METTCTMVILAEPTQLVFSANSTHSEWGTSSLIFLKKKKKQNWGDKDEEGEVFFRLKSEDVSEEEKKEKKKGERQAIVCIWQFC